MVRKAKPLTVSSLVRESTRVQDLKGHKITWRKSPKADLTVLEALDLLHEEVSECTRAYRDNNFEEFGRELAGVFIRCCHMAGDLKVPIGRHLKHEMNFNEKRPFRHGRAII